MEVLEILKNLEKIENQVLEVRSFVGRFCNLLDHDNWVNFYRGDISRSELLDHLSKKANVQELKYIDSLRGTEEIGLPVNSSGSLLNGFYGYDHFYSVLEGMNASESELEDFEKLIDGCTEHIEICIDNVIGAI